MPAGGCDFPAPPPPSPRLATPAGDDILPPYLPFLAATGSSGVVGMTTMRVSYVDVYVLRGVGDGLEVLVLRRGSVGRCPRSWETVHGHIDAGETPPEAALREMAEETGLVPERFYNISRVEVFYRHSLDEVALIPVFAAWVDSGAGLALSPEHDRAEWLSPAEAKARFAWPREGRALEDIIHLLGSGDAGPVEDVLRVR